MKKIVLLFWIGSVLTIPSAFSQNSASIGKVTISSPNAAALGKYGDIPVSHHTGIPNISIPIYAVKSGALELPITLDYHASGMKVQEQASWVGAGWSLNAGGVITRSVVGGPDDKGLNAAYTTKGHFTDYGYNSYLFSAGPVGCSGTGLACPVGRPGMSASTFAPQDELIQAGVLDGEPDLYFFNFSGYSGKFYFNDDRSVVLVPEQDLKITPIYPGNDWRGMTGFIITTPDGVRYYFGKNPVADGNPDAIEITYNIGTQNTYTGQGATSAWFLNKIVSADGLFVISLIYQAESYSHYGLSMFPIPATKNVNYYTYNYEYDVDKNFVNGVRLSKILFANGEVDFNAGALRQDMSLGTGPIPNYTYTAINDLTNNDATLGARALGSITIQSNNICKKDSFYFGYFFDNSSLTGDLFTQSYPALTITSDKYRLRLDSIKEFTCDGTLSIPPHTFSYFTGTVPRKLSFGIDHWGFYNGVTTNTGLIPTYTIGPPNGIPGTVTIVSGADRDSHWPNSLNGVLQQITYPTGGSSTFEFESNDVYAAKATYNKQTVFSAFAGFSGPSTLTVNGSFTTDASANKYELDLSSNQPANQTGGNISFSTGFGTSVGPGQSSTNYLTFSPSTTVNYTLNDNNNGGQISGYGVSAYLYEYIPLTVNANTAVGGIRIKKITNNDAITANNAVTSYRYTFDNVDGGQSSGQLYSRPVYVQGIRNDAWAIANGTSCSSTGCLTCYGTNVSYYQSPSSIRPMFTTMGNHIGYGEVYIRQSGNGYTKEQYYGNNGSFAHAYDPPVQNVAVTNLSTYCDPSIPNSPAPPDPFDPMRGELAFQGYYREDGVLLKGQNILPVYQFDSLTTPGLIGRFFLTGYITPPIDHSSEDELNLGSWNNLVPSGINTYTEYNLQSARKIKDSITSTTYDPVGGGYLTDIKTIYYNSSFHHQPTRTLSYSSKGESLITNTKYASDFRISNFSVPDSLPAYYTNIGTDNTYLTNAMSHIAAYPGNTYYLIQRSDTLMNYRYMKAIDRQTYIHYRRQNFTDSANVYTTNHNTAKSAANSELKPILELQDEYKNPVIESSTFRNANLTHAEFTHYDYVSNPANFVYPNKSRLVNLQSASSTFTNAAVSGNTLTEDSRYLDETTYSHSAGNLAQSLGHDGVPAAYLWNYANTLPIAKATNVTINQVAYTSFEADSSGSWTIGSVLRDAGGITGTQSYTLSNGACSRTGLTSTNSYVVSYWSKTGSSYTVTGSTAVKTGKTVNHWTYFEHTVTGTSSVSITGTGGIDELRLYPVTAQMLTYTYTPLIGMTGQCDADNKITYYEYDKLGRLLRIRDIDGNILKQYNYQYQVTNKCGSNCYIVPLQTSAGTNMVGYPVGVFDVHGKLLGNATGPGQYISLWNADTADSRIGTLVASADSLHFNLTLNTGMTLPSGVTGMRYYQADLAWNKMDGIRNGNATYVDFGDGTGMRLPGKPTDIASPLPANTTYSIISSGEYGGSNVPYYIHTYPDTTSKTLTFYHNDSIGNDHLDNYSNPASGLTRLKNFRGNLPQGLTIFGSSCYQQATMNTVAAISNWSSIHGITYVNILNGDGANPCKNMNYAQDFMQYNKGLQWIKTANGYYRTGYRDTTFRLSRFKSDWNTYFTSLQLLIINDDHWNREDLSALKQLNFVEIMSTTQNHQDDSNSPLIPISSTAIDAILNQVAAGAGQFVSNGTILLYTGGAARTTNSDTAVTFLTSKGWTISIQ